MISHEISEWPEEAEGRMVPGHWEGDTVAGKAGGVCLLTPAERTDGFLAGGGMPAQDRRVREA